METSGVGAGTYRSVQVDVYGRVIAGSNPTSLTGYGLDSTVYTKTQVDALLSGLGSGVGGVGDGLYGRAAIWNGTGSITASGIMNDNGFQITINGHLVINNGIFAVGNFSSAPSGAGPGSIAYSTTGRFYGFNGTVWKDFQYGLSTW
ncbi:hypothetical protein [Dyadobacter sp. CY323]|uniref:hypothetical protein n=1 Tax=Dyadobacter sp. CY323 TaxID=2907302 RepID=UPI001F19455B|nr:hypothetical protein [Dyadobacter sp. CY323]MCE6992107.1 hypothetical protein [Dyadobacter sp. CY323]